LCCHGSIQAAAAGGAQKRPMKVKFQEVRAKPEYIDRENVSVQQKMFFDALKSGRK